MPSYVKQILVNPLSTDSDKPQIVEMTTELTAGEFRWANRLATTLAITPGTMPAKTKGLAEILAKCPGRESIGFPSAREPEAQAERDTR
jgi:hypothetical protein